MRKTFQTIAQICLKVMIICKLELLSPDIKNRIKVRDIFFHPWVKDFEKEYKDQILHQENTNNETDKAIVNDKITFFNSNEYKENMTKDNYYKSTEETSKSNLEISKEKINFIKDIDKRAYTDKNLNKFNKDTNETTLSDQNINFFDEVLSKIQGKHKKKKKKLKNESKVEEIILDLIAEKCELEEKKESYDKGIYSILDEISIIESKISQIERNNKKYESNTNLLNVLNISDKENSHINFSQTKKQEKSIGFKENSIHNGDNYDFNNENDKELSILVNNLNNMKIIISNSKKNEIKNFNIDVNTVNKRYVSDRKIIKNDFYLIGEVQDEVDKHNNKNKKDSLDIRFLENYGKYEKKSDNNLFNKSKKNRFEDENGRDADKE